LADKDQLLKTLSADETRLRNDLQQKQAAREKLNRAIEAVIEEEVRRKVEEARKPASPSTPSKRADKPAAATSKPEGTENPADFAPEDAMSADFKRKMGKLPWPVNDGFISKGFGRQKHPTIKNIEINNNGIDIRTDEGAEVAAVYEGKVSMVRYMPGTEYTILLQHGNYYTVYSNLSETTLNEGDVVRANQPIGRVSTSPITGASELHFELWHQKQRLNPASWIKK
jgi:septal ring factor EnvC (AmiA/AmiB activator)